jgi:hypothetical protein
MQMRKIMKKRAAIEMEKLIKWIIAIVVLVLALVIVIMFSGKGHVILDKLRGIFLTGG